VERWGVKGYVRTGAAGGSLEGCPER